MRLHQELRQIISGSRKFAVEFITRNVISALTQEASEISGITYIMDCDREKSEEILNYWPCILLIL